MKWVVFLGIFLLLLTACVKEQQAIPLNSSAAPVPVATSAPAPAAPAQPAAQPAPTAQPAATPAAQTPAAPVTQPAGNQTPDAAPANTTPASTPTFVRPANLSAPYCLDTDGGDYPNIKGAVELAYGNTTSLKVDECLSNSLREWFCDLSELDKRIYICPKGCRDGACIE